MHRDPVWALVLIPAAPFPIQLPACELGGQSRTTKVLGPCAHVGDLEELLASDWYSYGHCSHLRVHQWMEDLPLCPSSSLYV